MLEKQLVTLDNEIKEKGYDPNKLDELITNLEAQITDFEDRAVPIVKELKEKLSIKDNVEQSGFSGFEK